MSTATMANFNRGTNVSRPATQAQIDFAVALVTEVGQMDPEIGREIWNNLRAEQAAGKLGFREISGVIDRMKGLRSELRRRQAEQAPAAEETPRRRLPDVPDGRYAVDNTEGQTAFYRVRVARSGFVTVSVMASDEQHELPFVVARSVLQKIESDGIKEAAIRYGQEIGACGVCGRTLTDPVSRSHGIGPTCLQKLG